MSKNIHKIRFRRGFYLSAAYIGYQYVLYKDMICQRFWFDVTFTEQRFNITLERAKVEYDIMLAEVGGNN